MEHDAQARLLAVAQQIQLDLLAVEACAALAAAGVPHVLIKGVTTARWLYDPPRHYRDIDLLVPHSALAAAVEALRGIAAAASPYGEEAAHSQVLLTPAGAEIDLHAALPAMDEPAGAADDRVWRVMSRDIEPFPLEGHDVPALGAAGRCVVLAMHVLASSTSPQVREDLRRALAAADDVHWAGARELAGDLGVGDLVDAAVRFVRGDGLAGIPAAAALRFADAPATALQFERLSRLRPREVVEIIARELFPSAEFMHRYDPTSRRSAVAMVRARVGRLRRILGQVPMAVTAIRAQRRRSR